MVVAAILIQACKSRSKTGSTGNDSNATRFERLYVDACTQFNTGNYTTALVQFEKCAELNPLEASVYYYISRIREKQNNPDLTMQMAGKANALAPSNKFYALNYAECLLLAGQYEKGEEILKTCIAGNLQDEALYTMLDRIYESQKATDKRIALWQQYKNNTGLKSKTARKLLELYKLKGDYTASHALYKEMKAGAPNKIQYYLEDAALYLEEKNEVAAISNFESAAAINPNDWETNYALFKLYAAKFNITKASEYLYLGLTRANPAFDKALPAYQMVSGLMKKDSAANAYGRIVTAFLAGSSEQHAKALYTRAELYFLCRSYSAAYPLYLQAASTDPNFFDAWKGAMETGIQTGVYNNTITAGEKALEYFPNTAYIYERLATAFNKTGNYDKALENAGSGIRFAFDDSMKCKLYKQKAFSLCRTGKIAEAEEALGKAVAINGADPELYDIKGDILFKKNDSTRALENWQKAKNMGINSTLLDKKISDKKLYE